MYPYNEAKKQATGMVLQRCFQMAENGVSKHTGGVRYCSCIWKDTGPWFLVKEQQPAETQRKMHRSV